MAATDPDVDVIRNSRGSLVGSLEKINDIPGPTKSKCPYCNEIHKCNDGSMERNCLDCAMKIKAPCPFDEIPDRSSSYSCPLKKTDKPLPGVFCSEHGSPLCPFETKKISPGAPCPAHTEKFIREHAIMYGLNPDQAVLQILSALGK
ncbi:MAG TPA: hypothetical protein DCX32_03820 [Candidatus Moranbacteria bacterium]|nr:hypothetical protein [Candidatus Moranbacteria bacterium]